MQTNVVPLIDQILLSTHLIRKGIIRIWRSHPVRGLVLGLEYTKHKPWTTNPTQKTRRYVLHTTVCTVAYRSTPPVIDIPLDFFYRRNAESVIISRLQAIAGHTVRPRPRVKHFERPCEPAWNAVVTVWLKKRPKDGEDRECFITSIACLLSLLPLLF